MPAWGLSRRCRREAGTGFTLASHAAGSTAGVAPKTTNRGNGQLRTSQAPLALVPPALQRQQRAPLRCPPLPPLPAAPPLTPPAPPQSAGSGKRAETLCWSSDNWCSAVQVGGAAVPSRGRQPQARASMPARLPPSTRECRQSAQLWPVTQPAPFKPCRTPPAPAPRPAVPPPSTVQHFNPPSSVHTIQTLRTSPSSSIESAAGGAARAASRATAAARAASSSYSTMGRSGSCGGEPAEAMGQTHAEAGRRQLAAGGAVALCTRAR